MFLIGSGHGDVVIRAPGGITDEAIALIDGLLLCRWVDRDVLGCREDDPPSNALERPGAGQASWIEETSCANYVSATERASRFQRRRIATMASTAAKSNSYRKAEKPASAADRLRTPPYRPTGGITVAQIRKAIREVRAERGAKQG